MIVYDDIVIEYSNWGGYDCMSAAWTIRRTDGRTLVCVDEANFETDSLEPSELAHRIFALLSDVQKIDKV